MREVIDRATQKALEFRSANESSCASTKEGGERKGWKKPNDGVFKVNTDAAVFSEGRIGYGAVVRGTLGDVRMACCGVREGLVEADVAEALAARFALRIAWEAGFRKVVLESDCLKLISHLRTSKLETSSFGNMIQDILVFSESFISVSFNHVCRDGNKVAHNLAQLSRSCNDIRIWMEEVPPEVEPFVRDDMVEII